jgi:hypothetical protein
MQDIVEQLKTQGYAIVRGFLTSAETAEIAVETDRMYAEPSAIRICCSRS